MNLNQITIPSIDIKRSILFYQKLGLNLIVHSVNNHYARFECLDGDATFSIHQVEQLPSGEGIYVYFECENLDKQVEELIGKKISFEELPNDKTWPWREARLKDPDQNQIILFHAGENRKNPPWRLTS